MGDKKSFAKMDKVKLLELLCQLTEENEKLTKRAAGLEEANAELMLHSRELEAKADEAQQRAEQCAARAAEAEQALRDVRAEQEKLPVGNFAEAVLQVYAIAQRTQQAADDYLAVCRRKVEEAEEAAAQTLQQAREQVEETIRQAEEHCKVLEERENVIRQRLRTEVEGLNQMVARLDEENV